MAKYGIAGWRNKWRNQSGMRRNGMAYNQRLAKMKSVMTAAAAAASGGAR
jgi:hypothetical protein